MTFPKPISELTVGPPNAIAPTGGMGLTLDEGGKVPGTTLKLSILAADPSPVFEGQVWIRSDTNQLRWREGGVTYQVTGTAV